MPTPELYFRTKENGALVFRVGADGAQQSLLLEHIATVNLRRETIRANDGHDMSEEERDQITSWIMTEKLRLSAKAAEEIAQLCETMGVNAHWITAKASDDEVLQISRRLHLSLHDLRSALNRRLSKIAQKNSPA